MDNHLHDMCDVFGLQLKISGFFFYSDCLGFANINFLAYTYLCCRRLHFQATRGNERGHRRIQINKT